MKALYSTKHSAGSGLLFYSLILKTDGILVPKIVLHSVENANNVKKPMLYTTGHIFIWLFCFVVSKSAMTSN